MTLIVPCRQMAAGLFASDVAYHLDKLQRTGALINIWVRIMVAMADDAATQALSGQADVLDVKLCQLVTLLDEGKPVKMSKRARTFVTLYDVTNSVGADVMRFIMLTDGMIKHLNSMPQKSQRKAVKTRYFMFNMRMHGHLPFFVRKMLCKMLSLI